MAVKINDTRRVSSAQVFLDGKLLGRYVVEIKGETVVCFYPLVSELAFTEWLQRPIALYTALHGVVKVDSIQ